MEQKRRYVFQVGPTRPPFQFLLKDSNLEICLEDLHIRDGNLFNAQTFNTDISDKREMSNSEMIAGCKIARPAKIN